MEDVFAAFERWGFDTKGWSRQTRYAYVLRTHRAHEWLEAYRETTITRATLRDLSAYHANTSPNARNRNSIRQALLGFYSFLTSTCRRDDNPAASLPRMPEPRSLPKALTGAQMQAVLAAAQLHGPMWHTYVLLLAYTGMRRDEARTLEWTGFEGDWVRFTAKGNRERVLPLHPEAKAAMVRWRAQCSSPRWVMPSPELTGPISTSAIHRHMHDIGDTANVPWLHSHALRHTYATGLLETGADIATVQEAMGHDALSSTQVYLRVRDGRVRQAVASLDW